MMVVRSVAKYITILLIIFIHLLWQYSSAKPLKVIEFESEKTVEVGPFKKFVLQTPNYPLPLVFSAKSVINLKSVPGRGYRFFFREFLLGPNQVLEVCSGPICRQKTNDEMVHRKDSAYLAVNGPITSMTLRLKRDTVKPDGYGTSGFQAIVEEFELSHPEESSEGCQKVIELSAEVPTTFIRSPNYPESIGKTAIECSYKIRTSNDIRVQFFDFKTLEKSTEFQLSGKVRNGTKSKDLISITEEFSGYKTQSESFARYFVEEVEVRFKSKVLPKSNNEQLERFFLIIDQFKEPDKVDACADVSVVKAVDNETNSFLISSNSGPTYAPNLNCFKKFKRSTSSKDTLLALEVFDLQTEACCDRLELVGIRTDPKLDDWRMHGAIREKILFAESESLGLRFVSDGIGQVKGFSARISEYDCSCGQLTFALDKDQPDARLESPGYIPARGYCPGLDCAWTVSFPVEDSYLEISLLHAQLRPRTYDDKNSIQISNAISQPVCTLSENSASAKTVRISGGMARVGFASDRKMYYDATELKKRGFSLQLTMKQFKSKSDSVEVIVLDETKQTHAIELWGNPSGVLTSQVIKAKDGSRVHLFLLKQSEGTFVDVFDGPYSNSRLLFSSSKLLSVGPGPIQPISSSGPELHLRFYSPVKTTEFAAIVSLNGGPNYGPLLCPSPFLVSITAESKDFTLELHQSLSSSNEPKMRCQSILFHTSARSDSFDALQLEVVPYSAPPKVRLFAGLIGDDQSVLLKDHAPYPAFVFGRLTSIEYDPELNGQINIEPVKRSQKEMVVVDDPVITGDLLSPDFPQRGHDLSPANGLLYVFEHRTHPDTSIHLRLVIRSPTDPAQIKIRVKTKDNEFSTVSLLDLDIKDDNARHGEFCARGVEIEYNPTTYQNAKFGEGLFGRYEVDGTGKCAKGIGSGSPSSNKMFESLFGVLLTAILWLFVL